MLTHLAAVLPPARHRRRVRPVLRRGVFVSVDSLRGVITPASLGVMTPRPPSAALMSTVHRYDSVARSLDKALTQIANAIGAIPVGQIGELPVRTAAGDAYDAVEKALAAVRQATDDVFGSER